MKKFLVFFVSFYCLAVFSQNNLPYGQLLVKKDSLSFFSFTEKGAYEFTFNDNKLNGAYVPYLQEIPVELKNIPFSNLKVAVSKSGVVYFIYPGGGLLFEYTDNSIVRIDESFPHRNQFSGHFFTFKEVPYMMGGYGYWRSNSLLTRFNFRTKEWDYVETRGQIPDLGVNAGSFVLENGVLYVFDFYQKIEDKDFKNDNLYELDLNSLKWTRKGSLNRLFYNNIQRKTLDLTIPYGPTKFLQKNSPSENLIIIEPSKNSVLNYTNTNLSFIGKNSISVGSKIVYTVLSADRAVEILVFKDFNEGLILKSESFLSNDYDLFLSYFLVVGFFCLILIALTFLKFKRDTFYFVINKNNLIGLNKSMNMSKEEKFVIELLSNSKNNEVDNVYFLNYFKKPELSEDANIKRKNKAINDLNVRFKETFQVELIMKSTKQSDSRQVLYRLNPKIIF